MAKVERFEDLEIWKLSREISKDVYNLIATTTLGNNFALRDQMDKASGSVMDNIAEGFERNGNKEFIQFLSIAKASCGELRSQLYGTLDRNHIDKKTFDTLEEKVVMTSKKIGAFMNYLSNSEFRGSKYRNR